MLINNQKYSCEACIRGHRVTTCKHHDTDRPLTKINRKGRPFSTCSICHRTPCAVPDEHVRIRKEREGESRHHYKVCFLTSRGVYMGVVMVGLSKGRG
ncbi:putative Cu-dependent DNA-binding protein [Aspergillus ruber CBS 135680]|uniref:Copper-fist-domain-containing protein n=1 Tax=Aspergillus ruber (strain CBS 135680) TaxID=1388766 RepID=A0A017S392_ASPRC|nr:copper-fist-domain-containing protein [Aspergillus ruber CBS 135680]EYE91316.1 copper-fist-domain-containing protein [Aspergillus ruber CBS 135680]